LGGTETPSMNLILASLVLLVLAGCSGAENATKIEEKRAQSPSSPAASASEAISRQQPQPNLVVTLKGPTAIGFFPPTTQAEVDADDGGIREGIAHIQFALEDVEKCLAPRKISIQFQQIRSLTIVDGSSTKQLPFSEDAFGIVLATPGKAPEVVYAGGPSILIETAPQAAWKYFSEPNCKRYEESGEVQGAAQQPHAAIGSR
jgi:hypothetical protein